MTNRVILYQQSNRDFAKGLIDQAPEKAVVTIAQPTRTVEQNAKVWAMLTDISKQCELPRGGKGDQDTWKCIVMRACKMECRHELDIDGNLFPIGYRSSQLTIPQCADLIEFMYAYGTEQGVVWSEPEIAGAAA